MGLAGLNWRWFIGFLGGSGHYRNRAVRVLNLYTIRIQLGGTTYLRYSGGFRYRIQISVQRKGAGSWTDNWNKMNLDT